MPLAFLAFFRFALGFRVQIGLQSPPTDSRTAFPEFSRENERYAMLNMEGNKMNLNATYDRIGEYVVSHESETYFTQIASTLGLSRSQVSPIAPGCKASAGAGQEGISPRGGGGNNRRTHQPEARVRIHPRPTRLRRPTEPPQPRPIRLRQTFWSCNSLARASPHDLIVGDGPDAPPPQGLCRILSSCSVTRRPARLVLSARAAEK